ncbi:MAG TPA: hypothetical protein VN901_02720 [Candidatus Acidoferrales bacterium]|nr:hypothetical protein [Candidatus Acidoferrales bacterium]
MSGPLYGPPFMGCWIISILVVLAGALLLQCQQAGESNKVSYEGQKVAAVIPVASASDDFRQTRGGRGDNRSARFKAEKR